MSSPGNSPPRVLLVSSTLPGVLRNRVVSSGLVLVGEVLLGSRLSELVHQERPDAVVLDVPADHPRVTGSLAAIGSSWPGVAVIAPATSGGDLVVVTHDLFLDLAPRLEPSAAAAVRALGAALPSSPISVGLRRRPKASVIAVGCSTGGPAALEEVLSGLPPDFPLPIVVAQHMPAEFTELFAHRLNRSLGLNVVEAREGQNLRPSTVYIAPGDRHLEVAPGGRLMVHDGAAVKGCRPSADLLFSSLASSFPAVTGCLLLSGMGDDGTDGARKVVESGGFLLCQDEASSVVWGMPGSAVRAGVECEVLPLRRISAELLTRVGVLYE